MILEFFVSSPLCWPYCLTSSLIKVDIEENHVMSGILFTKFTRTVLAKLQHAKVALASDSGFSPLINHGTLKEQLCGERNMSSSAISPGSDLRVIIGISPLERCEKEMADAVLA